MSNGPKYALDANVFIEANRRYYAFDLVSNFWTNLVDHSNNGSIKSIDRIKVELERGNDDLAIWAKNDFSHAFDSTDEEDIIKAYADIMDWVCKQKQFSQAAIAEFASGADGWLIAYAKVKGCIVVTHEQYSADVKSNIPIPNICKAFDISYTDTFNMLRTLGIRLS